MEERGRFSVNPINCCNSIHNVLDVVKLISWPINLMGVLSLTSLGQDFILKLQPCKTCLPVAYLKAEFDHYHISVFIVVSFYHPLKK